MSSKNQMTEELLRKLSLECFRNSERLYNAALLLHEHGYNAPAVALAVIGCEEFAKALVYAVGAALPWEREKLAAKIADLRQHDVKHLISQVAEAAQIENYEGWLIAQQEAGWWPTSHARLADMLISLGRKGISYLVSSKKEAKKYYKDLQKDLDTVKPSIFSAPSRLKEAALYVDFTEGEIRTPETVAQEASLAISDLEFYLGEYKALAEVLTNEEAWDRFSKLVRESVKGQPKTGP